MKLSLTNVLLQHLKELNTRQERLQFWQEVNQFSGEQFNRLNATSDGEWITPLVEEVKPVKKVRDKKK
jgi:hypothetical protein